MKIRRQKRVQRSLAFFRNNFGFHAPFQVLIDGTFCQAALKNKVNIEEQVSRYLGEVRLMTTSCSIHETELLGPALHGAMLIVKKFQVTRCGHEKKPISAAQCLLSLLTSNGNSNHFILATLDKVLKEQVRRLPGCPIMSLVLSALTMEKPCAASIALASDDRKETTDREVTDLRVMKSKVLDTDPIVKKRKGPKGPNPLSCKKKQQKPTPNQSQKVGEGKRRPRKKGKPIFPKPIRELLQKSN